MDSIIRTPLFAPEPRRIGRAAKPDAVIETPAVLPPVSQGKPEPAPAALAQVQVEPVSAARPEHAPLPRLEELEAKLKLQYKQEYEKALLQAREQAEQAGYAAGFKKGEEAARGAATQQIERLTALLQSIGDAKQQAIDANEDVLVELAFTAVCRIIGKTAFTRDAVIGMIKEASAHCREHSALKVHLNPQDWELLQQLTDMSGLFQSDDRLVLERNLSVKIGGCIIEGETGMLDARLDVQMARLRDALLAARRAADGVEGPI